MRSPEAEPRRAQAPEPTTAPPRRALPQPGGNAAAARLLGAIGIVLSFVAGLLAGPVFGLDPTRSGTADAATPVAAAAVTPATKASPRLSATSKATASSTPTPTDCKGATDTRRTAKARAVPFTVCGVALINKDHKVTSAYEPKLVKVNVRASGVPSVLLQPTAAKALVRFFTAAKAAGYTPVVRSSYRSYATQSTWYATMSHALTAPPGASEHQSGLAVDMAGIERGRLVRGTALASSRTGAWLLKNAATYGFILRYPTSESAITGIAYEPWHFRYVGVDVAKGVEATKTKTLERYLKVS